MENYLENLNMVPEHMQGAIRRYIEKGIPPGDFLTAVLSNNLSESFARADLENRRAMFNWVQYLYSYAPNSCWGSPERVKAWIEHEGFGGI
jgi:hypothetical protein